MSFGFYCLIFLLFFIKKSLASPLSDILAKYDNRLRPVKGSKTLEVKFGLFLRQLVEMDEKAQSIKILVWVTQEWNDDYLAWDPANYDGLKEITVPYNVIWTPDTYLYSNLQMNPLNSERKAAVIITPNLQDTSVNVYMRYPALYHSACAVDVSNFPFDTQTCKFTFGSWSYPARKIHYNDHYDYSGTEYYMKHQEWDLMNLTSSANITCLWEDSDNCYSQVNFTMVIRRKPLYFIINLIIPSLIVTEFCTLGMFTKSSSGGERGQKIPQGLSAIMSLSVFLLMTSNLVPRSSLVVPILGRYFIILIILMALELIATTIILHLQWLGKHGRIILKRWDFISHLWFGIEKKHISNERKSSLTNGTNLMDNQNGLAETNIIKKLKGNPADQLELLQQINSNLINLRQTLNEHQRKKGEKSKRNPSKYEKMADGLELFCLIFFLIANAVSAIGVVMAGRAQD